MSKLQRRAVLTMCSVIVWALLTFLVITGLFPSVVPWEVPALVVALDCGWLLGAACMRPDLFDEVAA